MNEKAEDATSGVTEAPDSPARLGVPALVLRLYVTGGAPQSNWAIRNVRALCETYLECDYDLEIIDIRQEPWLACHAQIVAAPTLVKELPPPLRRFIGTLADLERILAGLGLRKRHPEGAPCRES